MRFSYIDSQGKEIEVDSIESLALRIELGAVEPDTRLYDAVADRWAPAEEHPVFRSLSRGEEVTEDDIVPIGAGEEPEAEADGEEAAAEAAEAEPEEEAAEAEPEEVAAEAEPEPSEGGEDEEDSLGLDFQVTMADDEDDGPAEEEGLPGDEAPGDAEPAEEPAGTDDEGFPDFDLGTVELDEDEVEAGVDDEAPAEPTDPGEPEDVEDVEDITPEWAEDEAPAASAAADVPEPGPMWEGDEQEEALEAEGAGPGEEQSQELPPWAQEAPAWDDDEESEEPVPDGAEAPGGRAAGEAAAETADEPDHPDRDSERRAVPARPAHWDERIRARERRQRLMRLGGLGLAVAVVAAGIAWVVGVAGFGGGLRDPGGAEAEASSPIPVLPPDLRATLNRAGDRAWSDAVSAALEQNRPLDVAEEPPDAWLEGHYLANAGEYPAVEAYWRGIDGFVSAVLADAESAFPRMLRARLEEAATEEGSAAAGEVERLLDVGRQELELSAARRAAAVGSVAGVAEAAVELHRLLVQREDEIAYEPANAPGVSRDPVLEAVPETEALKAEMNAGLDRVLEHIEESRMSRPITTAGLVEVVASQLRPAGWRYREEPSPES